LLGKKPDATLEELRQRLGVDCSTMAIVRALKKLKITRKKKVLHAQERDTPEGQQKRREFLGQVAGIDPKRLVFVDESSANTSMTRTHGRAPAGERVPGAVPGRWDSVTLICGLRLSGVTAPVVFPGATDTPAFRSYVEQVLAPALGADDVVIWDNLQPHKAPAVVAAVERAGARVVPLPPSSPDLTPIEEMFSKVKAALRSAAARSTVAITATLGSALHDVSRQDVLGWFQSRAAYAIQS
jgi:transposase